MHDAEAEGLSRLDRLPSGCRVTGVAVQEAEPSMAGESSTLTVVSTLAWRACLRKPFLLTGEDFGFFTNGWQLHGASRQLPVLANACCSRELCC